MAEERRLAEEKVRVEVEKQAKATETKKQKMLEEEKNKKVQGKKQQRESDEEDDDEEKWTDFKELEVGPSAPKVSQKLK